MQTVVLMAAAQALCSPDREQYLACVEAKMEFLKRNPSCSCFPCGVEMSTEKAATALGLQAVNLLFICTAS